MAVTMTVMPVGMAVCMSVCMSVCVTVTMTMTMTMTMVMPMKRRDSLQRRTLAGSRAVASALVRRGVFGLASVAPSLLSRRDLDMSVRRVLAIAGWWGRASGTACL